MPRKATVRTYGEDMWNKSTIAIASQVSAVLIHADGSKDIYYGKNIVTNQGDRYYAATIVGTTATANGTDDFKTNGKMRLGTSITAAAKTDTDVVNAITGGSVALDAGYPKISDTDTDNTGSGSQIVTWRFTFGTSIANAANINEGAITNTLGASGTALTRFLFAAAFTKTSSDTLKVFVNHEMRGTT